MFDFEKSIHFMVSFSSFNYFYVMNCFDGSFIKDEF
jgi:hypothetical protein